MEGNGQTHLKEITQLPVWKEIQWIPTLLSAIVAGGVLSWTRQVSPSSRYYETYNPTISEATTHPYHDDLISYGALIGSGTAIWIVYTLILEFSLQRNTSKRQFYITLVNLYLGVLEAVLLTIAATEATKYCVGYLRPNFASVCQPQLVNGSYVCTTDPKVYEKSMVSFPSGHTSTGIAVGWFTTLYALWSVFYRETSLSFNGISLLRQFFFLPALLPTILAYTVAITRVTDFKHHTVDITMGTLLGLIFGTTVFFRVARVVIDNCAFHAKVTHE